MRKVRNVQPTAACSLVVTIIALLFLAASPMLGAPRPEATVRKAAEPVKNEYLIMLNVRADDVPKVAKELTKRYGGEVLAVWQLGDNGTASTATRTTGRATSSSARANKPVHRRNIGAAPPSLSGNSFQLNNCPPRSR